MTVVLDHEQGLVGTDLVQLLPGDEFLLGNGVWRSAEGNDHLVIAGGDECPDHVQNLGVACCIRHIQPSVEGSEAVKMDMAVTESRDQRPATQLHPGEACKLCRQLIAHIDDSTVVFDQILANTILRITGQDGTFVNSHGITSHRFDGMIISRMGNPHNLFPIHEKVTEKGLFF